MQLITKAIEALAPALYANDGQQGKDQIVVAKFFDPTGRFTFYMLEYDPQQRMAFGWCVSPLGPDCDEFGYMTIDEMEEIKGRFGLGIERDQSFTPKALKEIRWK